MRRNIKKLMVLVLSVAVMLSMMSISAFAGSTAKTTSTDTKSTDVTSTLSMLSISAANTKVTVNSDATVTVKLVTQPITRQIKELALSERDAATGAPTDSSAVKATGTVTPDETPTATGKYVSTLTFTIPVEKLGQKLPISIDQNYYSAKESKVVSGWWKTTEQQYITVANTPAVVNQLISKIYVQSRTAYTDKLCAQAKASWDALSEDDQAKVDEYDYFGRDTGNPLYDNARNQDNIGTKELLTVSFGTSFNSSRNLTINAIEKALVKGNPGYSVRRGFTAQIIINHIQARDNEKIDNMDQALDRAVANGVKELVVQPTHLMNGAEFKEMCEALDKYKGKIDTIKVGMPLLSSEADYTAVIKAIKSATADYAKNKDTAIVYMGHGTDNLSHQDYAKLQGMLNAEGDTNYFIGTVEGKPASTAVQTIIKKVKAAGYKKVVLRPLMVVAGDHANNDMAGDDTDSWVNQFKAAGFEVTTVIKGLGEIPEIQQLYVAHSKAAIDLNDVVITSLSDSTFAKTDYYNYDGKEKNPVLTVTDRSGKVLKEGTDYTAVKPAGRTNPGVYTYQITMKGSYSGTATALFTILAPSAANAKTVLSTTKYTYNGKAKDPAVKVPVGGLTLKSGVDYKVTRPEGRKSVGTYKYTVTFLGDYAEAAAETATITIAPKKTKVVKVKTGKKYAAVTIKKQRTQTTGYQIRYGTRKSMSGSRIATVKSSKTGKKVIRKLKSKKTYYFQVRTYKTVKGKKVVSGWSKTIKARVK